MARHRLVVIGDSLSQGFMSGAICRTDIAYPVWVADALGERERFLFPDFNAHGGLPINLEQLLGRLSESYGEQLNWWELAPAAIQVQMLLDDVEDYWERGRGAQPLAVRECYHNLGIWGFELADAWYMTEGLCRAVIPSPTDNFLNQVPEMPMYRTARRVLNSDFGTEAVDWSQLRCAYELGRDGGIENLVIALGSNNALGTVTSLSIRHSSDHDLDQLPHQRLGNLYLPSHFRQLYERLAEEVERIDAERVFLANVPHVTIPPATRGVSPKGSLEDGYFEFYTRPWVWDPDFDPQRHPHLTRAEVRQIDGFIDVYNSIIQSIADSHENWYVFDICGLLDDAAYRRQQGHPSFRWPPEAIKALKRHAPLRYLVQNDEQVSLDTRFLHLEKRSGKRQITEGGLFSLDGIHPTTIGYGLMADQLIKTMQAAGVELEKDLDWDGIVRADTLINRPPAMLVNLRDTLSLLDGKGALSTIFRLFD